MGGPSNFIRFNLAVRNDTFAAFLPAVTNALEVRLFVTSYAARWIDDVAALASEGRNKPRISDLPLSPSRRSPEQGTREALHFSRNPSRSLGSEGAKTPRRRAHREPPSRCLGVSPPEGVVRVAQ